MKISVVTTAFNEEKNIVPMYKKIKDAMKGMDYEIIAVDDCSSDKTFSELKKIKESRVKIIKLKERRGKAFALYEGLKKAKGGIIATIDADQQDDPMGIVEMVEQLEKGFDCICGWRQDRKDGPVKKISSRIGNFLNNLFLGVGLHDNTCPVKVFKKECIANVKYFGEFHRFIPIMIKLQGFKIKEHKVRHYQRMHGVSKYGVHNRIIGNIKTSLLIKFRYRELLKCS